MNDCIAFTNVSQELVAESFAFGSTLDKPGNIDNLTRSRYNSPRMNNLGKLVESLIGHCNHTQIRLNRTKREVCRLCLGTRQTVEQRRLSHVWQAYNSTFQSHFSLCFLCAGNLSCLHLSLFLPAKIHKKS